jgi:serine/threonine protein kinase
MKFSKTELDNMNKIDNMTNDLDNCGDKYCGNIITSEQIKEEGIKFSENVTKKCRSKTIPKTEKAYKIQQKKYDKCFTKIKKRSKYAKKLTQRKKCEDKKCSIYQKKIQNFLSKRRKNISIGGGKIFTYDGKIVKTDELYEGKDFFQKMTTNETEKKLCKIIMENPHKNIVKIYEVGNDYIKMEILNIDLAGVNESEIKEKMIGVKNHLQSLGIMYIDWKLDNIGISEDGELKLFDFDASGLIEPTKWEIQPPEYYSYREAIKNDMKTPIGIDNYIFENTDFHFIDFSTLIDKDDSK